jgi:aldose 1-epimerase
MLLGNADTRLVLDAAHGGAIREFSWRGLAMLRPAVSGADVDPLLMACFPLVPYANRIPGGRFEFAGRDVRLRRNWDRDPHPLHGQGWRSAWTVESLSDSRATLAFSGGGDDWPWRYRSVQEFELLADGLDVRLGVENQSDSIMPAVLGLHPYFPEAPLATVQARTRTVWLPDAQALPVQEVMTPADLAFDTPRSVARVALDHCFDHWDGAAVVRWPDRTLKISATGARSLHVYRPANAGFFCLEPQTAPAGALNRVTGEFARLAPGERLELGVKFSVEQA